MDREQILALYQWAPGTCFRHPATGETDTTLVEVIHPRAAADKEVRACRDCLLALEEIRRRAAEQACVPYSPGFVGASQPRQ